MIQGCLLAPFLFNLYLNDLMLSLSSPGFYAPRLASKELPLLFYANDSGLISHTYIGLKRLLRHFSKYCFKDEMQINYNKYKIRFSPKLVI